MKQHGLARWTDPASAAAPELASAVRAIRQRQGSAAQLDALSARLQAQLAAEVTSGSSIAATAGGLSRTKLIALVVVCIVSLGSLVHFAPATRAPIPAQKILTPQAPAVAPAQPPPAPNVDPAPTTQAPAQPAAATKATKPVMHSPRARARASKPVDAEGELALLGRAQAALDRDANAALALTAEHAREYPHGVFAEEREMLAIEAELKLKRDAAAYARAERFVSHYPRSAHARRVRTLLNNSSSIKPSTNNPHATETPTP